MCPLYQQSGTRILNRADLAQCFFLLILIFWLRDCMWARTINSAVKPTCCICSVTVLMARLPVFTQSLQTFPSSRFFLLSIRDSMYIKYWCCTNRKWPFNTKNRVTYFLHLAPKELCLEKKKKNMWGRIFSWRVCSAQPGLYMVLMAPWLCLLYLLEQIAGDLGEKKQNRWRTVFTVQQRFAWSVYCKNFENNFFLKKKMDSNFKIKVEISSANGREPFLAL